MFSQSILFVGTGIYVLVPSHSEYTTCEWQTPSLNNSFCGRRPPVIFEGSGKLDKQPVRTAIAHVPSYESMGVEIAVEIGWKARQETYRHLYQK
jgi:hypothetical protein